MKLIILFILTISSFQLLATNPCQNRGTKQRVNNADGTICFGGNLYLNNKDFNQKNNNINSSGSTREPYEVITNYNNLNSEKPNCPSAPLRLTTLPALGTANSNRPMDQFFYDSGFIKSCYSDQAQSLVNSSKIACPSMSEKEYGKICNRETIFTGWETRAGETSFNPSPCSTGNCDGERVISDFTYPHRVITGNNRYSQIANSEPNSLDLLDVASIPNAKVAYWYRTERKGLPRRLSKFEYDGINIFIPFQDHDCHVDSGCGRGAIDSNKKIDSSLAYQNPRRRPCNKDQWQDARALGQPRGICLSFISIPSQIPGPGTIFSTQNRTIYTARELVTGDGPIKDSIRHIPNCRSADYGYSGVTYMDTEKDCLSPEGVGSFNYKGSTPNPEPSPPIHACSCDDKPNETEVLCYGHKDKNDKEYYYFIDCIEAGVKNSGTLPFNKGYEIISCDITVNINGITRSCCEGYRNQSDELNRPLVDACKAKVNATKK